MSGSLFRRRIIGAGLAAALIALGACADDAEPLRPYGADPAQVTVSGFSAGGYMAVQFAVAHSAQVRGVASSRADRIVARLAIRVARSTTA